VASPPIWATSVGLAGDYFGRAMETLAGDIKHYEMEVMGAVIGVATLVWLAHFYRRRRAARGQRL
jgi:membrane protein DedA with SNARE-associated domain